MEPGASRNGEPPRALGRITSYNVCYTKLLRQGEFAQFLRQKTTERKQVLAKLFPIDDHLAVMETVKNRARETRVRLEEAERAVSALRATYDPETAAKERETLTGRIASLRKEQETGRIELKRLTAEAERARQHAARRITSYNVCYTKLLREPYAR